MQPGDKFIKYNSSSGKTIVGIVKEAWAETSYDLKRWIKVEKRYIKSTNNRVYLENDCYLVIGEIPPKMIGRLISLFSKRKYS